MPADARLPDPPLHHRRGLRDGGCRAAGVLLPCCCRAAAWPSLRACRLGLWVAGLVVLGSFPPVYRRPGEASRRSDQPGTSAGRLPAPAGRRWTRVGLSASRGCGVGAAAAALVLLLSARPTALGLGPGPFVRRPAAFDAGTGPAGSWSVVAARGWWLVDGSRVFGAFCPRCPLPGLAVACLDRPRDLWLWGRWCLTAHPAQAAVWIGCRAGVRPALAMVRGGRVGSGGGGRMRAGMFLGTVRCLPGCSPAGSAIRGCGPASLAVSALQWCSSRG